jgi:hypothetical protein
MSRKRFKAEDIINRLREADMSELARLAHVTQPRITQIINLNHLAPDIQEALLFLRPVIAGREKIHERMLREVAAEAEWALQAKRCHRLGVS